MAAILVVDDLATDRLLVGGLLQKHPEWSVLFAANGRDALEQIELHLPDVVLTDLQMPVMNGLELVEAVKKEYPLIPVILITAQGSEEIAVQALHKGAASYVPKRKLAHDLLDTVERVIGGSREDRSVSRVLNRLTRNDLEFEFENDLGLIQGVACYLRQALGQMRLCPKGDLLRVGIALEEALINAYYHGNLEVSSELREVDHKAYYDLARRRQQESPYLSRRIYVAARFSRDEVQFVIRDEGPGFDVNTLPDPTDPANLERPCGRGLLLIRTFMDDVTHNAAGNEITLIKRRSVSLDQAEEGEA